MTRHVIPVSGKPLCPCELVKKFRSKLAGLDEFRLLAEHHSELLPQLEKEYLACLSKAFVEQCGRLTKAELMSLAHNAELGTTAKPRESVGYLAGINFLNYPEKPTQTELAIFLEHAFLDDEIVLRAKKMFGGIYPDIF